MQTTHLVILAVYIAAMLGVALYFLRSGRLRGGDDFLFAGRSLPRPVMIATMLVTWVGSGTIIGGANFAYTYGPTAGMVFFAGTPLGILVLLLAARRIRRASRHTIPELLEARFGIGVRTVAAAVTTIAYLGLTASQFVGGGYVVSLVTPLSAFQGTLLVAVVVTVLTITGGLFSVAYTDFFSAILIVLGLIVSVPLVLTAVGGPGAYWDGLPEQATTFSGGLTALQLLGYFLPLFLLLLADQNMYQRLAAAKDEKEARSSTLGMLVGSFFVFVPVVLLATAAAVLMPGIDGDMAILSLASEGYLPAVLGGLILAGAVAFVITTGSSYMLSGASNVAYDLYARFAGERAGERRKLLVQRLSVLGVAVLGVALGLFFPTVLELQMYSYTIYGAAITPVVLSVLFWKRATTAGAVAALVAGTATTIGWQVAGSPGGLNAVIVALPAALVALVAVSLCTRAAEPAEPAPADAPA
ncbi:sodium:solute symporter family protein [Nocardiopsis changdeensis]|uniref:Sodium:solute symporter family protein n=1 Tax=Nocardiopsis changdeensis TaxID=2831969 RepID=A0ABX8BKX0_9ACTN|nr:MULTISPECIES: sodium:solute symporter family protein [Nocardiopsis]QUX21682.1 sodium:solute symporter family protein [Nocardiopsis changdeensis]QYX37616.1 sodium:solute symporter family protein [Nocardiopsis sp. MT53]